MYSPFTENGESIMKFTCAECPSKACEDHLYEKMPSEKACITKQYEQDFFKELYDETDLKLAHNAAMVEGEGYCKWTRVEETMAFAHHMGYKKIGIGFCVGFSREAATFAKILRSNGFEVEAASCKCGSIPKDFIDINKDNYADKKADMEVMCNPAGQAEYLSEMGCDMNVVLGLCVGHDTLFIRHSKAPVTVLSGKDRVLAHNPVGALYLADSYLKRVYHFIDDNFSDEGCDN